jgi:UDP-hydrolysing UDP-N-acetyl-D-glucosamine 2-epimerase
MNKRIFIVITARPSYSRIRSFLDAVKVNPGNLDVSVICAGAALSETHGNISELIELDGHKIEAKLHCLVLGDKPISMVNTVSSFISQLGNYLHLNRPDAIMTIADRYETISTAICASYQNIPLIHIQGGEISGNIDDRVRSAVTSFSDYHFVSNKYAYDRVAAIVRKELNIFNVGCPSIDLCSSIKKLDKDELQGLLNHSGVGSMIDIQKPYLVVLYHSDTEEYQSSGKYIKYILDALSSIDIQKIIIWPNSDAGSQELSHEIRAFRECNKSVIRYIKNIPGEQFLSLLHGSNLLIGNSSVGIRECSYLGVKVLNIGNRQRNRDRAENVIDLPELSQDLVRIIQKSIFADKHEKSHLYGQGRSGIEIRNILQRIDFD